MKIHALLIPCLLAAACGGSSPKPATPPPPPPDDDAALTAPPEERVPEVVELPPPQRWEAEATLQPVAGSKLAPATVAFSRTEGDEGARVVAELVGLKAGTYHLVIHAAAACGKNATKAGAIWPDTAGAALSVDVAKGAAGALDQLDVPVLLDGEQSIVGHVLVLHADKKGKPGKAVACGAIAAVGEPEPE